MTYYNDFQEEYNPFNRDRKKIAHNTWLYKDVTGEWLQVQFHNTTIMQITPEDHIILDNDGFFTSTTKERYNRFLPSPWGVYQEQSIWYLWNYETKQEWVWRNGMVLDLTTSEVVGAGSIEDVKDKKKLRRRIKSFSKKYVEKLLSGKIEAPDSGDCWNCLIFCRDGKLMDGHIYSHLDEEYYVPSLLNRAVEMFPVSALVNGVVYELWFENKLAEETSEWFKDIAKDQLQKSLTRYMLASVGLAR